MTIWWLSCSRSYDTNIISCHKTELHLYEIQAQLLPSKFENTRHLSKSYRQYESVSIQIIVDMTTPFHLSLTCVLVWSFDKEYVYYNQQEYIGGRIYQHYYYRLRIDILGRFHHSVCLLILLLNFTHKHGQNN